MKLINLNSILLNYIFYHYIYFYHLLCMYICYIYVYHKHRHVSLKIIYICYYTRKYLFVRKTEKISNAMN